jgi:innexin
MYTVQCVLPINLFNQQIFTMIWLWYMFVLFWNIINLFAWINREIPRNAENWTLRRVVLIDKKISEHKIRIDHFLRKYLDSDGRLKISFNLYHNF